MKILIAAYKFGTEQEIGEHLGTYHYFIEMTRRLVQAGHEVAVIAPWLSFFKRGSTNIDDVKIYRYFPPLLSSTKLFFLSKPIGRWYLAATKKIILRLDSEARWDAILVWQASGTGYAVAEIASRLRAPFLFRQITAWRWHLNEPISRVLAGKKWYRLLTALGLDKFFRPILEWLLDRPNQEKFAQKIYENAVKILFVSRAAAEAEQLPENLRGKIAVWPVAIESDVFAPTGDKRGWRQKLGIAGEKVLLFIGRINFAEKGIGYLLEAMPEIIKAVPKVNLVIIGGGGETARMQSLIQKLGIKDHVQLAGKKPFIDLPKYLNAADVFVMPSTWIEHFGQVTIEAMAASVPVVGTDIGATPEINLDGQTGLNVPPKDSGALAAAVIKLLQNEELRRHMGEAGRKRVEEEFTYGKLVNELIRLIEDVQP